MSANGGDAKLILDTGHPAWQVEWSPDGKHIAVCCEMHGQDYGVFIVELQTKESPLKSPSTRMLPIGQRMEVNLRFIPIYMDGLILGHMIWRQKKFHGSQRVRAILNRQFF